MPSIALPSARHSAAPSSRSRCWLYITAACHLGLILMAPMLTNGTAQHQKSQDPKSQDPKSQDPKSQDPKAHGHSATTERSGTASRAAPALPISRAVGPRATEPEFKAAIALGNQLFVLHDLAGAAGTQHGPDFEVVPLVHGQALLLTPVGKALHSAYTLAFETSTCSTESTRRVRLELDSGEPEAPSALGPAWIADEVRRCSPAPQSSAPLVAVVGRESVTRISAAGKLPQRVIDAPRTGDSAPCGLTGDEFLDAMLELRQSSFAVLRSFRDPAHLRIIALDSATQRAVLAARASLFWDDEIVGC